MEVMQKPFVHLFQTRNQYYIYDVNTSSIIRVNKNIYDLLLEKEDSLNDDIQSLYDRGYLKPMNSSIVIEHPATGEVQSYLKEGMKQLILQLTQNCNLRCKYCVYSGSYKNRTHTNKRMSFETAKAAIDYYYEHSQAEEIAKIGLYGGEPLLEFELIKKVTAYAESIFKGKELRINLTTNATLLNEENIEFMQKHDFDLMVSLDGPKEVQDSGRVFAEGNKGTFEIIMQKLGLIERKFPEYLDKISFNAVLGEENDFACSSNFFTYDFLKSATVMSTTVSDRDIMGNTEFRDAFYINYQYELFKSFIFYVGRLDRNSVSKLVLSHKGHLITSIHEKISGSYNRSGKCHPSGPCVAGANRLFVAVDGNFYPCERVSETNNVFNIGNLEEGINIEKVITLLNIGKLTEKECRECWALNLCSMCAADFGDGNELSPDKKRKKCGIARREAKALLEEYCTLREYGYNFDM